MNQAIYPMAIILVVEHHNASERSTRDIPKSNHFQSKIRFASISSSKDSKLEGMRSNPNLYWHDVSIVQSIANHIESGWELSEDVGVGVDVQFSPGEKERERMYVTANRSEIGVQAVFPVWPRRWYPAVSFVFECDMFSIGKLRESANAPIHIRKSRALHCQWKQRNFIWCRTQNWAVWWMIAKHRHSNTVSFSQQMSVTVTQPSKACIRSIRAGIQMIQSPSTFTFWNKEYFSRSTHLGKWGVQSSSVSISAGSWTGWRFRESKLRMTPNQRLCMLASVVQG